MQQKRQDAQPPEPRTGITLRHSFNPSSSSHALRSLKVSHVSSHAAAPPKRSRFNPGDPTHAHISSTLNRLSHTNQSLDSHHPLPTFLHLVDVDVAPDLLSPHVVTSLNAVCQLGQLSHRVLLDQILIVQVVVKNLQSFGSVPHLRGKSRRCPRLNSRHFCRKDLVDRNGARWNM